MRVFSILYIASRKAFTCGQSQKRRKGGSKWAKDSRQIFSKVSISSKLLAEPILMREVAFWSFFSLVLYPECFFLSSDVWHSDRSYWDGTHETNKFDAQFPWVCPSSSLKRWFWTDSIQILSHRLPWDPSQYLRHAVQRSAQNGNSSRAKWRL